MRTAIKNIANIRTGIFAKPSGMGEIVYLQAKHFGETGELLGQLHADLNATDISSKHLLSPGEIIFAAKGTKNFAAIYEGGNYPAVASTSFFVLKITNGELLPAFLAWHLNHPNTQAIIKDNARGTAIPSIRKIVLEDLDIFIPSIEKQQRILRLNDLASKEYNLRMTILQKRKELIDYQITSTLV